MEKTVSIVICTYNRAPFLNRTLYSLKNLNYKNFEVIVINGPSNDNTNEILNAYGDSIKIGHNPIANLSISRNMGIALSSGEIVAFIDDDAIPDKYWLDDIVSKYDNDKIGGVGGKVYGPGDDHFQFEDGYVDIWGKADVHYANSNYNDPNGVKFNMMLGTNCTFLRKVLIEVGGFDEYYEYYHDESDLAVRVIQAGYKIVNHERAYVHHEFAKSHIRENTFDGCRLNWYPIVKNKTYFAIKNSEGKVSNEIRNEKVRAIEKEHLDMYKMWLKEKKITKDEYTKFVDLCCNGYKKGYADGYNKERTLNYNIDKKTGFKQYLESDKILSICLLSKDDPIGGIGGTAKYTYELAKGFSKVGHVVHVITLGEENIDWMENGISFHKIKYSEKINLDSIKDYKTTYKTVQYSYCVYKKIEEIKNKYGIDIIESVLWDFDGAVAAHMLKDKLPVVIRLQTPLLKVIETQNWKLTDDLKVFADFEKQMMIDAAGIISISDNIGKTIKDLYKIEFKEDSISKVYLGVDENTKKSNRKDDGKIQILFVGRLERRKGIHTIIDAIPKLMNKYSNLEFRFVGNTEAIDSTLGDTYKNYFYKQYSKEEWVDKVTFLGQVSNETKEQEFANCDILLAPSLYESFGIILIEAMSSGKPVIASKIGGMQEILKDDYNGYFIDVENTKQLVEKLEILIENEELRKKFGKNGYLRYKEMFSNEAMIKESLESYKKYINKMYNSRV